MLVATSFSRQPNYNYMQTIGIWYASLENNWLQYLTIPLRKFDIFRHCICIFADIDKSYESTRSGRWCHARQNIRSIFAWSQCCDTGVPCQARPHLANRLSLFRSIAQTTTRRICIILARLWCSDVCVDRIASTY